MSLFGFYANIFMSALQHVCATMMNMQLRIGKPTLKDSRSPLYELSGIISLSGTINGSMVLSMPKQTAFVLVSALTGENIALVNADCIDALGEICNMVAGNAKAGMQGDNHLSLPRVVLGKSSIVYPSDTIIISIPCEANCCRMVVDVSLEKKSLEGTSALSQENKTQEILA